MLLAGDQPYNGSFCEGRLFQNLELTSVLGVSPSLADFHDAFWRAVPTRIVRTSFFFEMRTVHGVSSLLATVSAATVSSRP